MVEAVESHLDDGERVVYRLTSPGGIVHEHRGEETERESDSGGTVLVVSDRRLLFVVDTGGGVETATVPYADLQAAEADSGLVSTRLVVSLWGRGTLRMTPRQSGNLDEIAAFVSAASDVWERAVAALQDARQAVADTPDRVDAGDFEAVARARESAHEHIETARRRATAGPEPVERAIVERAGTVERELARAGVEEHRRCVRGLRERLGERARDADYDGAYECVRRAQTHLERARSLAEGWGLDGDEGIDAEWAALEEDRDWLEARPLARAEAALARARAAETPQRVGAWEHALACYRDALTAGWGTDAGFAGETDALRLRIESLVDRVVGFRCRLAERYAAEAATFDALELDELAVDRYETACGHLLAAERLASQYRAGDAGDVRERLDRTMAECAEF